MPESDATITIYANYGVLAHEKEAFWATAPLNAAYAVDAERVTCKLPQGYSVVPSTFDNLLVVDADGNKNLLDEALVSTTKLDGDPYLMFLSLEGCRKVPLTVIKREGWTVSY